MPEVCIVIPCFNEERRLRGPDILAFLREHPRIAVCFVDDGSSDSTLATIETLRQTAAEAVMVLRLPVNQGKAEAVRQGILHAASAKRFSILGYCDADLSTPLQELVGLLRVLDADPSCKLAMGARVRRLGSNIQRSPLRHYFGRVFSTWASITLRLPVYDSQCGAKVLRAELVPVLFTERFLTRWLFDVEILARLRNHVGSEALLGVTEVPLAEWIAVGDSKLRPGHIAKIPIELLKIAAHYNGKERRRSLAAAPSAAHPGASGSGPEAGHRR
jgi:glycosyltransferase involved in cell wall biosynthesis